MKRPHFDKTSLQLLIMALPILFPIGFALTALKFALTARHSRRRLQELERDASNSEKLIYILAKLEHEVEDAVVDLIDEPTSKLEPYLKAVTGVDSNATLAASQYSTEKSSKPKRPPLRKQYSAQPMLSASQKRCVEGLNKLPNLKKELAFINPVRNAHALIICREGDRYPGHRSMGDGVLRHWADRFIL